MHVPKSFSSFQEGWGNRVPLGAPVLGLPLLSAFPHSAAVMT